MLGRSDSRTRTLLLLVVFVVAAGSIVVRTAYWQVVRRDELAELARSQTSVQVEEATRRGAIYDRTGTVVLASTVDRDRLAAYPKILSPERRRAVAAVLVDLLQLRGEAATELVEKMTSDREYVVLARDLSPEISDRIRELSAGRRPALAGLKLEPEPSRVYPQPGGAPGTTLASHLLGFVNREGVGQYGVEQFYQGDLAGEPRVISAQRDINGRPIPETASVLEIGVPGQDLTLTIDASLQHALEQELLATWVADRAKRVSAVVLDPYSGAVYAWGSHPGYDANDFRALAGADTSVFIDPLVSTVYEPGSVFKMLTAAAALDAGAVTIKTRIRDSGTLKLDGGRTRVDDADHKAMGWMTFEDAIAYSRNVVAAKVALGLGEDTQSSALVLHEAWTRLGFGAPTGIDLAGEVAGIVRDPAIATYRQIDVANTSFGQGIAVTPIQLAQAYAAMVNGGVLVQPHVVQSVGERDRTPTVRGQVLPERLSQQLTQLMNHVVTEVDFYRDRTLIPGFEVGGKTGTAQIWDAEQQRWKHNLFNYSFVGYVGREPGRPDLVVAVRIEEGTPSVARLGQLEMPVMSFELFRRIAHDAITTPDLIPERPFEPLVAAASR
ncbi:MAG TPA: penicillin-binding protein 2 [Candidatus Limnocylindrales bacterium]|nr:penicillin-binding protein 2 [Candidatus Limnocylindrales bacterium]